MILLFDIGRTKFRLARSLDGETITEPEIIPTPTTIEAGVERIVATAKASPEPVQAIVIGRSRKVWAGAAISDLVKKELNLPVYEENDAALAGLGEAVKGAGQEGKIVVYVTVSSGVGGAKIEDGRIDESSQGFEPGEQVIMIGSESKTLEELVSGLAVARRFGKPPREITDEAVWQELSQYLAIGLTNILLLWSPDCLVLGGSMFREPGFQISVLEQLIKKDLTIFPKLPVIKSAVLGEASALQGGLIYLRQRVPA